MEIMSATAVASKINSNYFFKIENKLASRET